MKFRQLFDEEFTGKKEAQTELSVNRRLSISKMGMLSSARFTLRNPTNISPIKDKAFHLANEEVAKIKKYPGANLHSDPVHTTHNLYK